MSSQKAIKQKPLRSHFKRKRIWLYLFPITLVFFLAACNTTRIILQTAPSTPKSALAQPALTLLDRRVWETDTKAKLKTAFETQIYGNFPKTMHLKHILTTQTPGLFFEDKSNISVDSLRLENSITGETSDFDLVIVTPKSGQAVRAVILMQSFCPVEDVVPQAQFPMSRKYEFSCQGDGLLNSIFRYFFGRYIVSPPVKALIEHGYAFAVMHPPDFIPDSPSRGLSALNRYFAGQPPQFRTRAIMAWAKQFALTADYLKTKKNFSKTVAYGHSRYGKTALIAGAFNENIDAVIAHQSGTGGASLNRDKRGETVSDITEHYPHWFLEDYSDTPNGIDQHHLLALIAPRPLLLGNSKRDVWSDPEGAFRAAQGARPAYTLYGKTGLSAKKLTQFKPEDDIAFWMRPGTHGVVKEDWPAFLNFLDHHFTK